MKLTYFSGPEPNFGDELNPWLWPQLLPDGFLDDDESELFLGIGSILWGHLPTEPTKHVVGSGYGGYSGPPDMHDGSWNVVFVRGPRTARTLGLPPETAICDSAVLLRRVSLPEPAPGIDVAFMPHFESFKRGNWPAVCRLAGIRLIDPRDDVETVLGQIRGARLLITEAMHGAIVADAVRTPWIAIRPFHQSHVAKWQDWAESLGITLNPVNLWPSSLLEAYIRLTRTQKKWWGRAYEINESAPVAPVNSALTRIAARKLRQIAQRPPQLSDDAAIERVTDRAWQALTEFVDRCQRR